MFLRHRSAYLGALVALCAITSPASILFETGGVPTEQYPATALGNSPSIQQAIGFRFQLSTLTHITQVGGGFSSSGGSSLFAQIMNLGAGDLPDADPYASTGLGRTNFVVADGISDHRVAYDLILQPGSYALVFGMQPFMGAFGGPSGAAAMPLATGSPSSSDFVPWLKMSMPPLPGFPPMPSSGSWQTASGPYRFVIEGEQATTTLTPEPSSFLFFAGGLLGLVAARKVQRRRRPTS
jgi:hypothetical protein